MKWKKLKPCTKPFIGCLNCGGGEMRKENAIIKASMNTRIYNGFGGWTILKDNKVVYMGPTDAEWEDYPTLMKFENMARKDPDHDWRLILDAPLRGREYQRQGHNNWVLIRSDEGFA